MSRGSRLVLGVYYSSQHSGCPGRGYSGLASKPSIAMRSVSVGSKSLRVLCREKYVLVLAMASGLTSYFDRKPSSSIRPGLSHLQPDPSSPHTPQRTFSSTFSSPSISYRTEEETHVFELGARHLCAGLAGESSPRCTLGFGPEDSRRVGDYRRWLPGYSRPTRRQIEDEWGGEHDLWRMDLRKVDLGLVEDKIERAVRNFHTKYLLMDQKSRRLLLVLPSIIPHSLLSSILSAIFLNFQYPSITLFSTPLVNTVAAGCRSGLVVDVGFAETIVTAIYDYREIHQRRTTRGMKRVILDMVKMLRQYAKVPPSKPAKAGNAKEATVEADYEIAEDIATRMAWCDPEEAKWQSPISPKPLHQTFGSLNIRADSPDSFDTCNSKQEDPMHTVPSPFTKDENLNVPFAQFAEPVMTGIFAVDRETHEIDEHEQPVHLLMFKALLSLPPDARGLCMSRIIITGGGSHIPGLKARLLEELLMLVAERGWDPVEGRAAVRRRTRLSEIENPRQTSNHVLSTADAAHPTDDPPKPTGETLSAALQGQAHDPIAAKLQHDRTKGTKTMASGYIRGVETLGPWAGGSLIASLKIKGVVEIERDSFLQHGLAGARKDNEASTTQMRQSFGPNIPRTGSDKPGWTLGEWA